MLVGYRWGRCRWLDTRKGDEFRSGKRGVVSYESCVRLLYIVITERGGEAHGVRRSEFVSFEIF